MPIFPQLTLRRRSGAAAHKSIEYRTNIHGYDVLRCGEDASTARWSLNHRASPGTTLKHIKHA